MPWNNISISACHFICLCLSRNVFVFLGHYFSAFHPRPMSLICRMDLRLGVLESCFLSLFWLSWVKAVCWGIATVAGASRRPNGGTLNLFDSGNREHFKLLQTLTGKACVCECWSCQSRLWMGGLQRRRWRGLSGREWAREEERRSAVTVVSQGGWELSALMDSSAVTSFWAEVKSMCCHEWVQRQHQTARWIGRQAARQAGRMACLGSYVCICRLGISACVTCPLGLCGVIVSMKGVSNLSITPCGFYFLRTTTKGPVQCICLVQTHKYIGPSLFYLSFCACYCLQHKHKRYKTHKN